MGKVLDLDARRAEREPKRVRLGGREWELPADLPLYALNLLVDRDSGEQAPLRTLAESLVGPDEAVEFLRHLDGHTMGVILSEVYGLGDDDAGESRASQTSSRSTGRPSKRTSPRSTGSTSAKRAGGRAR